MLWIITDKGLKIKVQPTDSSGLPLTSGAVVVSVRPEKVQVSFSPPDDTINCFEGRLKHVMYLGTHVHYVVQLRSGDQLTVRQPNALNAPSSDTPIYLHWGADDCLALPE